MGRLLFGAMESKPESPSTITSLTSLAVGPINAILPTAALSANPLTHAAPARDLPNPRPARRRNTDQSVSGGNCDSRAIERQSYLIVLAISAHGDRSGSSINRLPLEYGRLPGPGWAGDALRTVKAP